MPTVITSVLKLSNEHMDNWTPQTHAVDGRQFIKLDCKDRAFFRFCTGKALTFGSKYENSKYRLGFWTSMVRARTNASQQAFQDMQIGLKQQAAGEENDAPKKRVRFRKARMDDAMTVGEVVGVDLMHNDLDHHAKFLFGVKNKDPWVEATAATMNFIVAAMKSDFNDDNFAQTRPRGPHFRLPKEDEVDEVADSDDDDENGQAAAGADE